MSQDLRLGSSTVPECLYLGKYKLFFVNTLCGKSYFGKKVGLDFLAPPDFKLSFEAPSTTFLDWLDIFSDAIDLINTLEGCILAPQVT